MKGLSGFILVYNSVWFGDFSDQIRKEKKEGGAGIRNQQQADTQKTSKSQSVHDRETTIVMVKQNEQQQSSRGETERAK